MPTYDGTAVAVGTGLYCTRAQLRQRLLDMSSYTAATLSFAVTTNILSDTAKGLERFLTGQRILISGSTLNNGYFNIATGGVAAQIVTTEALATEVAGDTVTIADVTDVTDDETLDAAISACSRWIDGYTSRRFFATTETRYYWPWEVGACGVDDLLSITTLKTDADGDRVWEQTWTAGTDYTLYPSNAVANGQPYTKILVGRNGSYSFPLAVDAVQIIGSYGYCTTTPIMVQEACLIQCARLFKRKDAPFGIVGTPDLGQLRTITKIDPDIEALLAVYKRYGWRV